MEFLENVEIINLVIWCGGATLLGMGLGYLGYLYSKLAYSIFTTSLLICIFLSSYLIKIMGIETPDQASQNFLAVGPLRPFMQGIENMGYLPIHIQLAMVVFGCAFFISRIATWAFKSFGPQKGEETLEQRKKRILKSYGMKNMEDLRSRY